MKKIFRKLNGVGRRNAGIIALLGTVLALTYFIWPHEVEKHVDHAKESDFVGDLLHLLPQGEEAPQGEVREVQVKYESGTLTYQGQVATDNTTGSTFNAQSTAPSGQNARFELVCGDKVCATTGAPYQEPLTFFLVQVPPKSGLTKLTVTAGASYLEVELA